MIYIKTERPKLWRRVIATLIDNAAVAAPLGLLAVANYAAISDGETPLLSLPSESARWLVPWCVTIPAGILLGAADHWGGTPGKRAMGLRIRPVENSARVSLSHAIARSLLKTSLPWELGHQAVWDLRSEHTQRGAIIAALAYGLIAAQIIGAARNKGRTYADHAASTVVERSS